MASAQEYNPSRLPVVVASARPQAAGARPGAEGTRRDVERAVEGHISLQGAQHRGLKGGPTVIAAGHAGYQRTQDLGRDSRKGLDLRI